MNEDRYLYCETITGEWWYKDMKTGENLPMYSTPIYRPTIEELNEECSSLYNKCKYLQSKIDKANEIINKLCVYKPYGYENANARPIKNTTKQEVYNAIYDLRDILKEDK